MSHDFCNIIVLLKERDGIFTTSISKTQRVWQDNEEGSLCSPSFPRLPLYSLPPFVSLMEHLSRKGEKKVNSPNPQHYDWIINFQFQVAAATLRSPGRLQRYLTLSLWRLTGGRSAGRWSWCNPGSFWRSAWGARRTAADAASPSWSQNACSRKRAACSARRWASTRPTVCSPTETPPPPANGCNLQAKVRAPTATRGYFWQPDDAQLTTGCDGRLEISQHTGEFCGELAVELVHEYVLHASVLKQMLQKKKKGRVIFKKVEKATDLQGSTPLLSFLSSLPTWCADAYPDQYPLYDAITAFALQHYPDALCHSPPQQTVNLDCVHFVCTFLLPVTRYKRLACWMPRQR